MVPVRSELTQPKLPSVLPTRLLSWEANVPSASGPVAAVFPATMVLPRAMVPLLSMPPPWEAELPLIVQSVTVALLTVYRPPPIVAELP